MEDETEIAIPLPGGSLVDQLMAEQDDVMRQLEELDERILQTIRSIVGERAESEKTAA